MKRVGSLFDQFLTIDNFRHAWLKAIRGKRQTGIVRQYARDLDKNFERVVHAIKNGNYVFGKYGYFTIYDPKERIICAASFEERIIHHALMNVLDPVFERSQIFDSYACRRNKGT